MKKYEMLLLLNSEMTEEAREAEIKKYADIIVSMGGNVEATDKWGVKKTSYAINYNTDALYVLVTFVANENVPKELDRVAGLSGDVLRRMITKVA